MSLVDLLSQKTWMTKMTTLGAVIV